MTFLSLARSLRQQTPQLTKCLQCSRRGFAEVVDVSASSSEAAVPAPSMKGVDWRKGRIPVKERHGLYAFFRKKATKPGETLEGDAKYEVFETPRDMQVVTGRGWKSEELRLKSFKDLHTLWYVLLRERNLLATQKEEVRRMGVQNKDSQVNAARVYHVRKSMARIKQVLNERRVAYEKAYDIASTEYEAYHNEKVLSHLRRVAPKPPVPEPQPTRTKTEAKSQSTPRKTVSKSEMSKSETGKVAEAKATVEGAPKPPKTGREMAGETAAAGLFGSKS